MVDTCIFCGEIIPEGRMVCWACEHGWPVFWRGGLSQPDCGQSGSHQRGIEQGVKNEFFK